jgi:hypothetical protein
MLFHVKYSVQISEKGKREVQGRRKIQQEPNLAVVDLVGRIFVAFFASGGFSVVRIVLVSVFPEGARAARAPAIRDTLAGTAPSLEFLDSSLS